MAIELGTPDVDGLAEVVAAMREWQVEGAPIQLHPGDLGWFWRFGAETTAAATRTWARDGRIVAAGLLDGEEFLRVTIAPDARQDEELAVAIAETVDDADGGVLGAGQVFLELPPGVLLYDVMGERGWLLADPWTPLRRDVTQPVESSGLRIEVTGPDDVADRVAVQRAAFDNSTFTEERWHDMASGPAYADARCLVGYDDQDNAVATITVWSAGPDRPGLIEPMGVHHDHRGQGHGQAICLAAAAALQALGSSSALVCTPSSNVAAVATYVGAGFEALPERRDPYREA